MPDHAGTLPKPWASMQNLAQFDISENHLTGTLPETWSTMTGLLDFTASQNNIHGAAQRCRMHHCLSDQRSAEEPLFCSARLGC
jgi:hypothetical protein